MARIVHWHDPVLRMEDSYTLRMTMHSEVECQRNKGKLKRTWKKYVEEESMKVGKMLFANQSGLLALIRLALG